jgi:hypothetical protein
MGSENKKAGEDLIDQGQLKKSWNESLEALRKSVGGNGPKVAPAEDDDDSSSSTEEESSSSSTSSSTSSGPPAGIKKSLPDLIAEDPEAEAAMDIEPYLKSLALGIDKKTESLEKAVADLTKMVKIQSKAFLASMDLQKSMQDRLDAIGNKKIPVQTVLKKSDTGRFSAGEGQPEMSQVQIMNKAMDLSRQGVIGSRDVTILEGRLNSGGAIPEHLVQYFK